MLQIENRTAEFNPYYHSPNDSIAAMNLDYWLEQIKAAVAAMAHLAEPVAGRRDIYLPIIVQAS